MIELGQKALKIHNNPGSHRRDKTYFAIQSELKKRKGIEPLLNQLEKSEIR